MRGGGGGVAGSQPLCTRSPINFGDLSPYLTFQPDLSFCSKRVQIQKVIPMFYLLDGPLSYFSTFVYRGVHIGARAPHDINLIWFGYIARLSQWRGGGAFYSVKLFLPALAALRGGGSITRAEHGFGVRTEAHRRRIRRLFITLAIGLVEKFHPP